MCCGKYLTNVAYFGFIGRMAASQSSNHRIVLSCCVAEFTLTLLTYSRPVSRFNDSVLVLDSRLLALDSAQGARRSALRRAEHERVSLAILEGRESPPGLLFGRRLKEHSSRGQFSEGLLNVLAVI